MCGRRSNENVANVEWYSDVKSELLGEKNIYILGGRRSKVYIAYVELYWNGNSEISGGKYYTE